MSHFALQNALTVNLWVVYFARMPLEIAPRVWHSLNTHNSIIGDAEATIATAMRDKRIKQTNRWHFILFQFFFPGTTTMYIEHSEPPNRTLTLARSFVRNSGLHNKRVRIYALYYELDVCFALTLCIPKIPFLRFCITQSIKWHNTVCLVYHLVWSDWVGDVVSLSTNNVAKKEIVCCAQQMRTAASHLFHPSISRPFHLL